MGRPPARLDDDDRRTAARWAAACAAGVLPRFAAHAPDDPRPAAAIAGARAFARGAVGHRPLRALAMAAHAAARAVDDPAAVAAARAAGFAAATVGLHADPRTVGALAHVVGAAAYAARARALADGDAAAARERRWAVAHAGPAVRALVQRLPPAGPGGGWLAALVRALDADLRG